MVFHLCALFHPHSHPNKTTSSFLVLPPQSHQTLLSFPQPLYAGNQPLIPSPEFQKQYTRGRNSKGQHSHLGKSIFGCEGCLPWASGEGRGRQVPSPGAGSEVHAPGGLTDARVRRSREGGNRNKCLEGNRFFVLLLLLDFFCLWIVKSCSGGCPPGWGCTHTRRSPGCRGPAMVQLCSGESPGWLGRRLLVASSDEIFFLFFFFLSFPFL